MAQVIKPSIWAYCITTSWAFFEGNIKTARLDGGLTALLDQHPATEITVLAKDLHNKLQAVPNTLTTDDAISQRLLEKFPDISTIVSNTTPSSGACVALLITKNEKVYSVVLLGIASPIELVAITSKIINHHLL